MKALTFKYTKASGQTSERTVLAMVTPSDKYAGIDLSELDPITADSFMTEARKLHEEYVLALKVLQNKYDLKYSYKQFLASGMSDVEQVD